MIQPMEQLCDAIRSAGLNPPDVIEADGRLHRFPSNGRRGDDAGWYVLHDDGIPAGAFGDWRTGINETWRADIGRRLTPDEEAAHRARVEAIRREREAEETRLHMEAKAKAAAIWQAAQPATDDHPYLKRKNVRAHGLRVHDGRLVIPMRQGTEIHSLQFIGPDGDKRFLTGGRVTGCYFSIGTTTGAAALCIAEGFATGATIHEATGYPVAVAFNAGNLESVAKALRAKLPNLPLILCADDDAATEGNPGLTKATEAARSVGGKLAVPDFGTDRPEGATDFNDLHQAQGLEAVERATAPASAEHQPDTENAAAGDSDGWPEPLPLVATLTPEPYPLDALPDTIRNAVAEVQAFVKAPVAIVASSALAALSVAIQAHADVQRADKLTGPASIFLLTIANSGERKSTCDDFFTTAIRDYEAQQAESAKPAIKDYEAAKGAWAARQAGVREKIKSLAKTEKPTSALERGLRDLEDSKPEAPRVPKLLRGDDTPENLAWVLSRGWPSAGVLSSEAATVLGSHGMGTDSIMRNLGLLNILWDGGVLSIGRRTSESFTVKGARLTMGLQVQGVTLCTFFDQSKGLARGTGFLARFLVACPESTQGHRPFTEAPANWPHLAAFHRRIAAILDQPAPINEDGSLTPPMLTLTPEAKAAWVEYHNAIEGELASGGELYDVRDVASKSADNAARLAALFHVFGGKNSNNSGSNIQADEIESASRIAAWHLHESRRFFGELALPVELANAARLDTWLIAYCRRERTHIVPIAKLQQGGPGGLRSKATIETVMRELEDASRARWKRDGKRKMIAVNPALIIEGGAS